MDLLALVAAADRIGIVAAALGGVAVGMRSRLDLFGLLALGLVAAIGGGITRDVVIGEMPRAFITLDYLLFAVGASVAGIVIVTALRWEPPEAVADAADAIGTGAFAATGALLAAQAGLAWPAAILLAIITATGGGVARDVLATRVPRVLHSELNATAAAVAGLVTFLLRDNPTTAALAGGLIGAAVSGIGHLGWLRVPRPGAGSAEGDAPLA